MKALGWIVAGLLVIALLWTWKTSASMIGMHRDQKEVLLRSNDSLAKASIARDLRIAAMMVRLDTLRAERDRAWAHVPPAETLYIGHRAQAATLSYRRKWADMGTLPRDSTATRYP